ncbi:hypothetical protein PAAG_04829 [Paracoccidioides lutzii Pb01]|uniref:Yeast cell wall synthesis Kre9/Knh1-like N-terminal domain-containing protein n=1 Tax=Paracoccidioides lutzii (strain ATCC MYA-826 / Pb01) TaxID=502779 RepID=C1H1P3_PARBA|nr:hypothetical protein PAAG_04829 [Paracoccidioides lutzii Pb01]EEH33780.1 hypothetical protein PAAG_04829 [Paracoccidioides lutzii Pb01]
MHLVKALVASALLVATAVAQGISFTSFPDNVQVGEPVTVTWTGGTGAPVTITLRKGPREDLRDVQVLTTSGKGGSFTWTPDSDLANGNNYALQISQGTDVNYGSLFSISGGSGSNDDKTTSASVTTTQTSSLSRSAITPATTTTTTTHAPTTGTPSGYPTASLNKTTTAGPRTRTTSVIITPSGPKSAPPTPTPTTGGAAVMSSSFALIMGVLAAFAYLN